MSNNEDDRPATFSQRMMLHASDPKVIPSMHTIEEAKVTLKKESKEFHKALAEADRFIVQAIAQVGLGDVKAVMSEDDYIRSATLVIKREGPDIFLRNLIETLRNEFGGRPLVTKRNKLDRCPCGSTKKYGKCCGKNVEESDPVSCKSDGHQWKPWGKVSDGKWIRGCEYCMAIDSVDGVLELGVDGDVVIAIPCRTCKTIPDEMVSRAIYDITKTQMACAVCKKPQPMKLVTIEHPMNDGKHDDAWQTGTVMTGVGKDGPCALVSVNPIGHSFFVHDTCLTKKIPSYKVGLKCDSFVPNMVPKKAT